jgi:hypothetical protein
MDGLSTKPKRISTINRIGIIGIGIGIGIVFGGSKSRGYATLSLETSKRISDHIGPHKRPTGLD